MTDHLDGNFTAHMLQSVRAPMQLGSLKGFTLLISKGLYIAVLRSTRGTARTWLISNQSMPDRRRPHNTASYILTP